MLRITDLSAGYGGMTIVREVNLHLQEQEIVTLVGPNGSGKSTLLRAVTGIIGEYGGEIYDGKVMLDGKVLNHQKPHELLKLGIAFVPDGGKVFPSMTARENLEMGGFILKGVTEVEERINDVLRLFPILGSLLNRKSATLSGGERQILSLARALMIKPKVLVLDEPSAGLSPNYVKVLFDKLKQLKERSSILMAEQNAQAALEYSDRGYVMRQGKFTEKGQASELLEKKDIFSLL